MKIIIAKYLVIGLLLFLILSPLITKAEESSFDKIIASLLRQIEQLKEQISQLREDVSEPAQQLASPVAAFTKFLQRGNKNEEVKQLQELLGQYPDVYPEGLTTGYFGPLTEAAVKRFQAKYGIGQVGTVDSETREKLNEISVQNNELLTPEELGYAPGELLIKFKPGIASQKQKNILDNWGFTVINDFNQIKVKHIKVPETAENALVESLSKNPNIEFVELNKFVEPEYIPNDPQITANSPWHHIKIKSYEAWDITSSTNETIAIADTGVDPDHPDLMASLVTGYNTIDHNSNTVPVMGHGTAVAGTAAAIGNNANQIAGVAYNARIAPIRITNRSDGWAYFSDMAEAVIWAADNNIRIINLSYNGVCNSSTVINAGDYLRSKGGIAFIAAGNDGIDSGWQANEKIVCVSATHSSDSRASFSNYGAFVDMAAPGTSILTTNNGGGTGSWSGTSFSSPLAAGLAALVWGANPTLTNDQIEQIMKDSAVDLGTEGWDKYYGWGRINAKDAVALAKSTGSPVPDTIAPTTFITSPQDGDIVSDTITVTAIASDNRDVQKVELWKNSMLLATDTTAPYSFVWNTQNDENGTAGLQTRANDEAGNIGVSTIISITVSNEIDTIAPTAIITQPADGFIMPKKGTFTVSVSASDNVGVSQIDIFLGSKLYNSCYNITSCDASINVRKIDTGDHTVSTTVYDAAGNTGTDSITVTKGASGSTNPNKPDKPGKGPKR